MQITKLADRTQLITESKHLHEENRALKSIVTYNIIDKYIESIDFFRYMLYN